MKVKTVSLDRYREVVGRPWQIKYDRMLDRVIDNSKILNATGMKQSELTPLKEGLRMELQRFSRDPKFRTVDAAMQKRFDRVAGTGSAANKARGLIADLRRVQKAPVPDRTAAQTRARREAADQKITEREERSSRFSL